MDKNKTEGEDLRGNRMLWTIEHWAKVMGSCAGSDRDLLFEKSSVGLMRIEEFSYGPLFSFGRQGTNGWKTRRLQGSEETSDCTKNHAHLATAAYDICDGLASGVLRASLEWTEGALGKSLLRSCLGECELPVDVLPNREKPERRMAKRRKVVTDDEEDLTLWIRRAETEVEGIRQSRTRARPKRKASRGLVVTEVLDSSVEKTVAPIVNTPEVAAGESTQPVVSEGPSAVLIEVPTDVTAEPLKEGTEMVSPNSLSSKRTRFVGSEEVPQPKKSEELMKKVTLSEKILEQVVAQVGGTVVFAADVTLPSSLVEDVRLEVETKTSEEELKGVEVTFPDFLQDSVVPLLKYLDRKREKYDVSKEVGFYVELLRNRTQIKRAVAVKREWDSVTEMARERAAILSAECATAKAALKEQEDQLREKEIKCEVLQLNMTKES
ncbi:hypothetical protein AXG93_857s1120 [Marchantia polymorpha subsp. ruderalis]|uniref:Uncharacterized protein n=1 Tax=Marchantia polymorpha subsp. ruderalis TaxID=1480154 RepID=A0A176WCA2_MARPO|nr:hypothetical protein AXG93_857s1120 [Marchantia polymorpha subsp. ruderalis]